MEMDEEMYPKMDEVKPTLNLRMLNKQTNKQINK